MQNWETGRYRAARKSLEQETKKTRGFGSAVPDRATGVQGGPSQGCWKGGLEKKQEGKLNVKPAGDSRLGKGETGKAGR